MQCISYLVPPVGRASSGLGLWPVRRPGCGKRRRQCSIVRGTDKKSRVAGGKGGIEGSISHLCRATGAVQPEDMVPGLLSQVDHVCPTSAPPEEERHGVSLSAGLDGRVRRPARQLTGPEYARLDQMRQASVGGCGVRYRN